ncbi:MAG: hypothetical protein AVDCRST_MAG85-639 [uncultured Solirubrobacteraceae bacterium]|uniref:Uncharacterized protein n=1 Tax=uncultured Solirubrobacteraceae bacterium TaxID=1162706 RepID=A0A6J4S1E1_9ACTN|nr:MAG: hypothetical protein AVDCRST_MAG85-639 [uncultured Solirubrobacteraceae bacterium]
MRRMLLLGLALVLSVTAAASAHELLDHATPTFSPPTGPLSSQVNAGGEGAEWELIDTIPTGNPHSDLDFFTRGKDTYMSAGTLGTGPNAGGQNIFRLTENGEVKPSYVGAHPSAACPQATSSATALQHDVEATPKGGAFQQQPNPFIAPGDAQLLVDTTDAGGRCHDSGGSFGVQNAPRGGLELIDITNVDQPKEIALISHIGNAHTVNVDPKRPHIAFDITQDGVTSCEGPQAGKRNNEVDCTTGAASTSFQLDGFEVVDMKSCMNFPAGTTIEQKRKACRPEVYRYRFPEARMAASHFYPTSLQGCHETEIYPDDRLVCASITSTILFSLKNAFDDNGTPTNFLDDKPKGTPLPCKIRESTSPATGGLKTGAPIVDCVNGEVGGKAQSLIVSEWQKIGSPSLEGVEWLGTVPHLGFRVGDNTTIANAPRDSKTDIIAAHESEITQSGKYVITSDERGGGTLPPGASCSPGADNPLGNGGLHFFHTDRFSKATPLKTEDADKQWAKTPQGAKAVYRAQIRTQPQATICTSHVFQQIPGQNRIFLGWYSQGTQVIDFTENPDGTITFKEAGYFIPENANTWVSHIFKAQRNQDGSFTYWGAASDGILPGAGRQAIDIFKVTLPPAPVPAGERAAGTPDFPLSRIRGIQNEGPAPSCTGTAAFERTAVRGRGRALSYDFVNRGSAPVGVELYRESRGRRVVEQRVGLARPGSKTFRFTKRISDGYYYARFTTRAANGGADVRRVSLQRRKGRWIVREPHYRREACALVPSAKLSRTVFGGTKRNALGIAFRLGQASNVTVEVRQNGKLLQRFGRRSYPDSRTIRLLTRGGKRVRRGDVQVIIRAERVQPGRAQVVTLTARRL